jgi:hypothetical protein
MAPQQAAGTPAGAPCHSAEGRCHAAAAADLPRPCYLGRYNDGFNAPRNVLKGIGIKVVDMQRSGATPAAAAGVARPLPIFPVSVVFPTCAWTTSAKPAPAG